MHYTLCTAHGVTNQAHSELSEEQKADCDEAVNTARADTLKQKGKLYIRVLQMANEHKEINENLAQMPEEHQEEQVQYPRSIHHALY
jgi:hypothetical protein